MARPPINQGNRLKIAIQRAGPLTRESEAFLRAIDLNFESYGQRLFADCRNFPLSIFFTADDDIAEYVASGVVDLGIIGKVLVHEAERASIKELLPLGFGHCSLVVAVPKHSRFTDPNQLGKSTIATPYPRSARQYFDRLGISPTIVKTSGPVESTPLLGLAHAVVELTPTGATSPLSDLRSIATVLKSEAVLVANQAAFRDPKRRADVDKLLLRVRAVREAQRYRYVVMSVPASALPAILEIVPGLRSPAIIARPEPGWMEVQVALKEEDLWGVIDRVELCGAKDIVVSSLDKLVL